MEKSTKSNQKLNKHKVECNELSSIINRTTTIVNQLKPSTPNLINIADVYRDKIYEIDRELENQSIDFWDESFELRDAIILHLKEKLVLGLANVIYVSSKVLSMSEVEIINKNTKRRKNKQINKAAIKVNDASNYIETYNLKDNINETLLTYFLNIDPELLRPNDLTKTYLKMKENARSIGIDKEISIEKELIELIESKEKISEKFNSESKDYLNEIYKDLGVFQTQQNTTKVRRKAL